MNRSAKVPSVKPVLEQLEGRDMPSFLLSGAVGQMAAPLVAMNTDLSNAKNDLQAQFQTLSTIGLAGSQGTAEAAFGKATADWQRMQNDQHAIAAVSAADTAFINAAALSEFQNGDSLDLIVLYFGPQFGLHPTFPLTDPVNQANASVHDATVTNEINTDFFPISPLMTTETIAQAAPPPSF